MCFARGREDRDDIQAAGLEALIAGRVRYEGRKLHAIHGPCAQRSAKVVRHRHLRCALGRDERSDFDMANPGREHRLDQSDPRLERNDSPRRDGILPADVLKSVAGGHLADLYVRWHQGAFG